MAEELDYSVRISPRARRARIVVHPGGTIEVVLPRGVSRRQVPAMLQAKRQWLESAVLRMREAVPQLQDNNPPEEIALTAIAQHVHVDYLYQPDSRLALHQNGGVLRLTGPVHDHNAVCRRLQAWLKGQGKRYLPSMLDEVAHTMGVRYQKVTVRLQKTRWGSCSVLGNISLNARLLLLPQELLHYVLVHELSHLVHHNHSPAFWRYVERFEPDYRHLRRQLVDAGRRMPGWIRS